MRTDGYDIAPNYDGADVVVVNTCGFIDRARAESLDAIGEAINENGREIVTGCMGVDENEIRELHPAVLSVSGPQQYEQVVSAVHRHAPFEKNHDPFTDLVPPQGVKLTPRHYAYLKISEGCNHNCTFCIIPSMRGKLDSRPVGQVLDEAERLVDSGVKELLVISQDTSAYGVDLKYKLDFWGGKPVKTRMTEMCRALGSLGAWVRLHYVYPYPHVDELIPDVHGNSIAVLNPDAPFKFMLAGHIDEIGLMITHIDDKGFILFDEQADKIPQPSGTGKDESMPGGRKTFGRCPVSNNDATDKKRYPRRNHHDP